MLSQYLVASIQIDLFAATETAMIATGFANSLASTGDVQLLDIVTGQNCIPQPAPYPTPVFSALGAFIDGSPMICGGKDDQDNIQSACWT